MWISLWDAELHWTGVIYLDLCVWHGWVDQWRSPGETIRCERSCSFLPQNHQQIKPAASTQTMNWGKQTWGGNERVQTGVNIRLVSSSGKLCVCRLRGNPAAVTQMETTSDMNKKQMEAAAPTNAEKKKKTVNRKWTTGIKQTFSKMSMSSLPS